SAAAAAVGLASFKTSSTGNPAPLRQTQRHTAHFPLSMGMTCDCSRGLSSSLAAAVALRASAAVITLSLIAKLPLGMRLLRLPCTRSARPLRRTTCFSLAETQRSAARRALHQLHPQPVPQA